MKVLYMYFYDSNHNNYKTETIKPLTHNYYKEGVDHFPGGYVRTVVREEPTNNYKPYKPKD